LQEIRGKRDILELVRSGRASVRIRGRQPIVRSTGLMDSALNEYSAYFTTSNFKFCN
jgi:hypothetical protein